MLKRVKYNILCAALEESAMHFVDCCWLLLFRIHVSGIHIHSLYASEKFFKRQSNFLILFHTDVLTAHKHNAHIKFYTSTFVFAAKTIDFIRCICVLLVNRLYQTQQPVFPFFLLLWFKFVFQQQQLAHESEMNKEEKTIG